MDKEKLRKACDAGFSIYKIAADFNCSYSNIRYWLKKFSLKTLSKNKVLTKSQALDMNLKRWGAKNFNWIEIQKFHDEGRSWRDINKKFCISMNAISKAAKSGLFKSRSSLESRAAFPISRKPLSAKVKENMSIKRKEWLAANPEKHPWRRHTKFKSIPCEYLKNILKNNGYVFSEEMQPLLHLGRYFAVDIAFIGKKIIIEVNGNQHYNKDKTLKPYYFNRNELIKKEGWTIYEVHYSLVYNEYYINNLMKLI